MQLPIEEPTHLAHVIKKLVNIHLVTFVVFCRNIFTYKRLNIIRPCNPQPHLCGEDILCSPLSGVDM